MISTVMLTVNIGILARLHYDISSCYVQTQLYRILYIYLWESSHGYRYGFD